MRYRSTRDPKGERTVPLREAVLQGLAPDGGLYLPEEIPTLPADAVESLRGRPFADSAQLLAHAWLEGGLPDSTIRGLVQQALDFPVPMVQLGPGFHVLELFHGPTASFKDVGARFLAALLSHLRRESGERVVILTATSGDTGGAVAHAVKDLAGVEAVILYPHGRISPFQLRQMTSAPGTAEGRVRVVAVEGSFDDCQQMVKELLVDPSSPTGVTLTSANSVNLGRLIPQTFYYLHARAQWDQEDDPVVSVPSGNLGNLTAGVLARRAGVPLAGLVAACNVNRPLSLEARTRAESGERRGSVPTLSSAMDVANPSNLERLVSLLGAVNSPGGWEGVAAHTFSEVSTLRAMRSAWKKFGYMADPHTAVGWLGLTRESPGPGQADGRGIVLATAHPGKFSDAVEEATGLMAFPPEGWSYEGPIPPPYSTIPPVMAAFRRVVEAAP